MPQANRKSPKNSDRKRGRPTQSQHAFMRHLAASGTNLSEWSKSKGLSIALTKAWVRKDKPTRPPDYIADDIAFEFGLPADERTWPQGIRITRVR